MSEPEASDKRLVVEIWSDVVCPWCYVGKRRFEAAVEQFEHREEVEVVWRSFELDRGAPARQVGDYVGRLAAKYGTSTDEPEAMIERITDVGRSVGLEMRFDRAQHGNTFDAHRLLHLARARHVQDAVKERFMQAYFTEGRPIGDRDTLVELAVGAGLDAGEVAAVLDGDEYAAEVRADEEAAARLGASGVPFFVVDRRYAVSGAQATDLFIEVLERAWAS
ncbi:MAG TPA: DsbA family oxidoreductase [Acidimicrobiales bacterium]|nr:DsbA family oxidoreductase [Acidimicrobiales bacterium]